MAFLNHCSHFCVTNPSKFSKGRAQTDNLKSINIPQLFSRQISTSLLQSTPSCTTNRSHGDAPFSINCAQILLPTWTMNMYADDTSISYASNEINELFNEIKGELDLVSSWMRQNKLSLNAEKSEFMLIGHPKQLNKAKDFPDLEVEDQKLCRAQKTKYLGVIIDESMNWEEQLKTIKRKIKNGLGAMFKLKNILSQKQLATVYRALIESHLRYCSVIWGCLSNTKLESLQRLQNRARRLIECARHKDGWVCDWLDVRNLIKYDQLITTYKIKNGLCPENLKNKFTPRSNISKYNTRKIDDFEIPRLRLEYCKKSFGYQGASAWNEIPKQIRDSASLSSFKVRLREFLR